MIFTAYIQVRTQKHIFFLWSEFKVVRLHTHLTESLHNLYCRIYLFLINNFNILTYTKFKKEISDYIVIIVVT